MNKGKAQIIKAHNPQAAETAAEVLKGGGVIVYPTDTLYGLGALVSKSSAVEKIFDIKGRDKTMSLPVLARDFEMLFEYAEVPERYKEIIMGNMPGAFMAVLKLKKELNPIISAGMDTIGIRIAGNEFAKNLMQMLDEPLISTSANPSGSPNIYDMSELIRVFEDKVALIVDSGSISPSKGSTIVDFTACPPAILRRGDMEEHKIQKILGIR